MKKKQKNKIIIGFIILVGIIAMLYFQVDAPLSIAYNYQCSLPNCPSGYNLQSTSCEGKSCYGVCEKPVPAYCGDYGGWMLKESTTQWDGTHDRGDSYLSPKLSFSSNKCYIAKAEARFIPSNMGSADSFNIQVAGAGRSSSYCISGLHTFTLGLQETIYGHSTGLSTWTSAIVTDYGFSNCGGGDPWTNMKGLITTTIKYKEAPWIDYEVENREVQCSFDCSQDSDCGSTGAIGQKSCYGGNVVQNYESNSCSSYNCISNTKEQIIEFCDYGCESGNCIQRNLLPFYRLENNDCTFIQIFEDEKQYNDYNSLSECQGHIQEENIIIYRLEDNCNSKNIKISQRQSNDYDTRSLCISQINQKVTYFRLSNNFCNEIILEPSEKTSNDYTTFGECSQNIDDGNGGKFQYLTETIFWGIIFLLIVVLVVVLLLRRK